MKIDNPYVYRVFSKVEFENFKNKKFFNGNEFDLKSGFIHLSKKEQLKETLSKYFKNEKDLERYIIKLSDNGASKLKRSDLEKYLEKANFQATTVTEGVSVGLAGDEESWMGFFCEKIL